MKVRYMTLLDRETSETNAEEGYSARLVTEISRSSYLDSAGDVVTKRIVSVEDESDPFDREILRAVGDTLDQELIQNPSWQAPSDGTLDTNPAAHWLYLEDPNQKSMAEWLKLFPSAMALYPLQRLEDGGRVLPGGYIDDRAKFLFTNMVDGIGLRARARVMADILVDTSDRFEDNQLVCVSLGCGAAVPDIDAAVRIKQESGKDIEWHLYDIDGDALNFASELATEAGIDQNLIKKYQERFISAFKKEQPESVHAVDVLGLWEYLDDRSCVKLLQRSYDLLKPGGSFIASNMLSSRPQLDFNLRGVGWPLIKPRFEQELVDIVTYSGVLSGPNGGKLTFTESEDGVYGVMEIHKP